MYDVPSSRYGSGDPGWSWREPYDLELIVFLASVVVVVVFGETNEYFSDPR